MKTIGAKSEELDKLTSRINNEGFDKSFLDELDISVEVRNFLKHDLEISMSGTLAEIIGAFTLGREKVIPNMFGYILTAIEDTSSKYLITYLQRHIDVDGDRHGPLSMKLLKASCNDEELDIAYMTAIKSLELRLLVWDKVYDQIRVDNI